MTQISGPISITATDMVAPLPERRGAGPLNFQTAQGGFQFGQNASFKGPDTSGSLQATWLNQWSAFPLGIGMERTLARPECQFWSGLKGGSKGSTLGIPFLISFFFNTTPNGYDLQWEALSSMLS